MSTLNITADLSGLERGGRRATVNFGRTLDRFVMRAAGEFVREEKIQAPKAFSQLVNSIQVQRYGVADYGAVVGAKHGAWVNDGTRPHTPPMKPLMEWLRLTKRVSGPDLFRRARGLQRFIAAHGTKANPFVQRTDAKMRRRVIDLMGQGVHAGFREAFPE